MQKIKPHERGTDGRYALTTTRRSAAVKRGAPKRPLRPWPAWHREALKLLLEEELTQRTIAERLGVSYSAVRKCFARPATRRAIRQHSQRAVDRVAQWADEEAWKFMPTHHCTCCSQRNEPRVVWPLNEHTAA